MQLPSPTGIRSFRHIFTSSAFKGINIAPASVAGLNGWLGGQQRRLHVKSNPSNSPWFPLPSSDPVQGDAVTGFPQRQDPEPEPPACILPCLEDYPTYFICIYISSACCSFSRPPRGCLSIYAFAISNKRGREVKDSDGTWCRPRNDANNDIANSS